MKFGMKNFGTKHSANCGCILFNSDCARRPNYGSVPCSRLSLLPARAPSPFPLTGQQCRVATCRAATSYPASWAAACISELRDHSFGLFILYFEPLKC